MAIFIDGALHGIGLIDGVPIAEVKLNGEVLWGPGIDINVVSGQFTQTYLDAVGWTQRRGNSYSSNLAEDAFGYVTPQTTRAYFNYNSNGYDTQYGQLVQQGLALTIGQSYTFRVYRQSSSGSQTQTMLLSASDGTGSLGSVNATANGWAEVVFVAQESTPTTQLFISMINTYGYWPASMNVSEIQFYETP